MFIPNRPDCDYTRGENLLSPQKIKQLGTSFKTYNIIDYEHQYTIKDSEYFRQPVGTPLKTWISQNQHIYTDITGKQQNIPPGTLWLKAEITDPQAMKRITDKKIIGFSASTCERNTADKIKSLDRLLTDNKHPSLKSNFKSIIELINNRLSIKHRVLISEFEDPVIFSVSITEAPCVRGAVFCNQTETLNKTSNKSKTNKRYCKCDNMTNKDKSVIDKLQDFVISLKNEEEPQNPDGTTRDISTKAGQDPEQEKPENKDSTEDKTDENTTKTELTLEKLNKTLIEGFTAITESLKEMEKKIDDKKQEDTEQEKQEDTETANKNTGKHISNKSDQITPQDDGISSNPSYNGKTDQQIINEFLKDL